VLIHLEDDIYVQLIPSGAGPDSNYYPDGEINIQALIVPGEMFAGYPALRVFSSSPAVDPATGQPLELLPMEAMNDPLPDPFGNNDVYIPPDLVIDTVELAYYAMGPMLQSDSTDAPAADLYAQPVWHFHGHYTNGSEVDILVQALEQEFLSPNFGQ
jgi:hypothetical protein